MKIKPTLIKLNSVLAGQFGIDPRIFIRSLFELLIYLSDWAAFRIGYAGSMKFAPCLHDRYEKGIVKNIQTYSNRLRAMKQSDNTEIDKIYLIYKVAKQWGSS